MGSGQLFCASGLGYKSPGGMSQLERHLVKEEKVKVIENEKINMVDCSANCHMWSLLRWLREEEGG